MIFSQYNPSHLLQGLPAAGMTVWHIIIYKGFLSDRRSGMPQQRRWQVRAIIHHDENMFGGAIKELSCLQLEEFPPMT